MGLLARLRSRRRPEGTGAPVQIADPRFDDWEVVGDFEDLTTARSWLQHLKEAGFDAVLTSDWPLDRFGRGDISMRVPRDRWSVANELLSGLDLPPE